MVSTTQVAIKVDRYIPNIATYIYSNNLLRDVSVDESTIHIRLSGGNGNSSNDVVRMGLSLKPVTGTSDKVDNELVSKFIQTLAGYQSLKDDWDGYGGVTPTPQTIQDAIKLVKKLPLDALPTRVGVSNDGEISIIWDKGELFADFGVIGDSEYCYFIKSGKQKLYGDELSLSDFIPKEVINLLRK